LKIVAETRKILGLPDLAISVTTVRIPVETGHSEAVWVETDRALSPDEVRAALAAAPGGVVRDDPRAQVSPLALEAAGTDQVPAAGPLRASGPGGRGAAGGLPRGQRQRRPGGLRHHRRVPGADPRREAGAAARGALRGAGNPDRDGDRGQRHGGVDPALAPSA